MRNVFLPPSVRGSHDSSYLQLCVGGCLWHWCFSGCQGDHATGWNQWTLSLWSKWRKEDQHMELASVQVKCVHTDTDTDGHLVGLQFQREPGCYCSAVNWRHSDYRLFNITCHPVSLYPGDRIVKVNGESIIGKTYSQVISLIQNR